MLKRDISRRGYVPYYEHAKIIAIVDKEGEVLGYEFTVTEKACDFFAGPDDREKYTAITVKPVPSDDIDEIKGMLSIAQKYLRIGQYLASSKKELERLASDKTYEKSYEKDNGLFDPYFSPILPWTVSPLARAQFVQCWTLLQVNDQMKMTADYKLGDIVCLREGNLKFKATILARHDSAEQFFIGSQSDAKLVGFHPKHVIHHTKPEQRSDASPPESEPKPEQSGEVAKQACVAVDPLEVAKQACFAVAPQAAADIVLLPAPKLLRSRR